MQEECLLKYIRVVQGSQLPRNLIIRVGVPTQLSDYQEHRQIVPWPCGKLDNDLNKNLLQNVLVPMGPDLTKKITQNNRWAKIQAEIGSIG